MIIHDRKRTAGVILSKMGPSGMDEPISEDSSGDDLKAIAQDMLKAFENKDSAMLVTALKAFMDCVEDEDEEQDSKEMG